jgi:opacity protein-like surface antigen
MKTLLASAALIAAAATPAWAQGNFYVEGAVGHTFGNEQKYNSIDFDVEDSFSYGGAVGWTDLLGPFDVELDVYATDRGYDGFATDLRSVSVMANALYDFPARLGPVGFYAGAGLGMINVEYDGGTSFPAFSDDEWVFGWQAMAGARSDLGPGGWSIFGEWRYQDAEDADLAGFDVEYSSHTIAAGVRYTFQ